jgi:hypothetical protein
MEVVHKDATRASPQLRVESSDQHVGSGTRPAGAWSGRLNLSGAGSVWGVGEVGECKRVMEVTITSEG